MLFSRIEKICIIRFLSITVFGKFTLLGMIVRVKFTIFLLVVLPLVSLFAAENERPDSLAPGWVDSFESEYPKWQLLNRENQMMVLKRARTTDDSHENKTAEKWDFIFPKKSDIFLVYTCDFPWLIEELSPSVWVKSNHPGIAFGAQIVLPHTYNPKTGQPFTFLVSGSQYTEVGTWQKLDFCEHDPRTRTEKPLLYKNAVDTVKLLRAQHDFKFDFRNMYVRQLILYVEGNVANDSRPRKQTLWIDDLHILEHAPIWSTWSKGVDKLEPEYAAFNHKLNELRKKEAAELAEIESQKTDEQHVKLPKNTASALLLPKITIVGDLNDEKLRSNTSEGVQAIGFRPRFDPINLDDFLMDVVSESVYPAYSTEDGGITTKWEGSIISSRTELGGKSGISEFNGKQEANRSFAEMHGIGSRMNQLPFPSTLKETPQYVSPIATAGGSNQPGGIEQVQYQPQNANSSTGVSESIYYQGASQPPLDTTQQEPSQRVRIRAQTIRATNMISGFEQSFSVRAVEYRGEPLAFLKELRFNAVWLSTPPSPKLLEEANEVGIWLICPPPSSLLNTGTRSNETSQEYYDRTPPTPPEFRNVLAWNLGQQLEKVDVEQVKKTVLSLRNSDDRGRQSRPFICSVNSGAVEYGRIPEIVLLAKRDPLLSTLDLQRYRDWLTMYKKAVPSTPCWVSIQTQPDPRMVTQWDLFGGHREQPVVVTFEQMRMLSRIAIATGSHGLVFTSNTPLTEDNTETRYRAASLALLNLELMLIEEWFAEGAVEMERESIDKPQLSAIVLTRDSASGDKAKLLIPLWSEPNSQYVMGQAAPGDAVFLIPMPETHNARLLTPGGLEPIKTERVAGGMQIRLEDANLNSLVVSFNNSSRTRGVMEDRVKLYRDAMSRLAIDIAKLRLQSDEKTLVALKHAHDSKMIPDWFYDGKPLVSIMEHETLVNDAKERIKLCEDLYKKGGYTTAYKLAEVATRGLRATERNMWIDSTRMDENRSMTPVSTCFQTIPFYISMFNSFRFATRGSNMISCGDFEHEYPTWASVGWRLDQFQDNNLKVNTYLHPMNAHSGNKCLSLVVESAKPEGSSLNVETPPVWCTTPGVHLSSGQLICVTGWINVPQKIEGSVDGVMITDSIGGEALALRFDKTDGWREFTFFRRAPSEGVFHVKFFLTGVGNVLLDDIAVYPVIFNTNVTPHREQNRPPTQTPSGWDRLRNPFQYLPTIPGIGGGSSR